MYRPLFELASGGMGTVSLALRRESSFERLYAVKRLRTHVAEDTHMREMFLSEARVAGLIRHPNVVSVLDVGEDAAGPFFVMEWVDGVSLGTWLSGALSEGPIPVPYCIDVAAQIARGLHAAHELRTHSGEALAVVHRDVSPQNVLVGFDGLVRVTDFGISKVTGTSHTTGHGVLKGKLGYLSPEQLQFMPLDRRSDLFSLGIVLFEMLAGRRLYTGKLPEMIAGPILREPAPSIREVRRDVEPELEELLFEMLAKSPTDRPDTAQVVAERLDVMRASIDDEELPSLRDFTERLFRARRTAMQESIARAMDAPEVDILSTDPDVRPTPSTGARVWRVASVVGALAVGAVSVWFLRPEPEVVAPAPVEAPPAEEAPMAAEPVVFEPPAEEPEEVVEAAETTRMIKRRRRPRMREQRDDRPALPRVGEGGWNAR